MAWLVQNHFPALEAAFQEQYGLNLTECLWGDEPMSVRRLANLCANLTPGGPVDRSADPEGYGSGWTTQEELLALIAELVDYGNRNFVQVNSKPHSPAPKPIKITRPSDRTKQMEPKRQATIEEMKAFFGGAIIPPGELN